MKKRDRPRRYVSQVLSTLWLVFRYCEGREAYVLRLVGERLGAVLRPKRRFNGQDRRGELSEEEAFERVW